ncbi:MAG: tetratricopeptide repeat protein [Candidatus Eremiobacteraeota bacterium]|nr:tetratricopeptide repeat protein [Candidatus Eremiobacteraeota bacterium]
METDVEKKNDTPSPEPEKAQNEELEKKRRDAQLLSTMGAQLQNQKRFNEALDYYSRSKTAFERLDDKEGMAAQLRSMAHLKELLNEYGPSLELYGESKKLFKEKGNREEYAEIADRIGKILYKEKKFEDAVKEYLEAIDFGCRSGDIFNNLGFVEISLKLFDEAAGHLETARDIRTEEKSEFIDITYNNLGAMAYLTRSYEKAREFFQKALELNQRKPKDDRTIQYIVFPNEKHKKDDEHSFEVYNDVLTRAAVHLNLASTAVQLADREGAMAAAEKAQTLDPDMPYLNLPLAWVFLALDEKEKAITHFKKVLAFYPGSAPLRELVEKINPYAFTKVGRNEECPCGSGKKFKKCHGKWS